MQDFWRMVTATVKILILVMVYAVTFCTLQSNADAVKAESRYSKCPADSLPKLLPHDTDCSLFYVCVHGKAIVKKCPSNLQFNRQSSVCDYPQNVDCQKGINKKGRDLSDILCPLNEDGNPILRPHETDCRKFYTCNNGITLVQVCQHGLHFNAQLQQCDYPENAGCEKAVTKVPKGNLDKEFLEDQCSPRQDGKPTLLPHERDCRKFYVCHEGFPRLLTCQSGLHFNSKLQACDYPENAGCETGIHKKGRDVSDILCPLNEDGNPILRPHETDCRKFYTCNNGITLVQVCQHGLHFNAQLQQCDYPENAGCEKVGILRSVGVASPYCPEVTGKISIFYRHPSNCSVYYLCSHGLAYEFVCPAKLYFSLRQKRCDYEDIVLCPTGSSRKNE